MTTPEDAQHSEPRLPRRLRLGRWVLALLFTTALVLGLLPVYVESDRMCATCGLRESEAKWAGLTLRKSVRATPLNDWRAAHGGHVHRWWYGSSASGGLFVFYRTMHGSLPPIGGLTAPEAEDFLTHSTPAQITAFLALLDQGAERDQPEGRRKIIEALRKIEDEREATR